MEGYKKTALKNHKGEIILPQTAASMVSEESDRRFVDNVEKTILNKLAVEGTAIDELIANAQAITALSREELTILNLVDTMPNNFLEWGLQLEELNRLTPFIDDLLNNLGSIATISSTTTGAPYSIQVNDTNPDDLKIVLSVVSDLISQPDDYNVGTTWSVPETAPDVKILIPTNAVRFYSTGLTILPYDQFKVRPAVSAAVLANLVNGVENTEVSAAGDNMPQALVTFKVKDELKRVLGMDDLENSITRMNLEISTRPTTSSVTNTYTYQDKNVVQPVRRNTVKGSYSRNSFSHLTWTSSIDAGFMKNILNGDGTIALNVSGDRNSSISLTSPYLEVWIENPYKGKTLVATTGKVGEFSILDWEVQD